MRIRYDPVVDALYIGFLEGNYQCTTLRINEDVALDIASGGRVVGVEVLDASENLKIVRSAPKIVLENLTA